jgi:hypothetical protein
MAVGSELGQLVGVVPGTYDSNDIAVYIVAFLIAGAWNAKAHLVDGGIVGAGDLGVR